MMFLFIDHLMLSMYMIFHIWVISLMNTRCFPFDVAQKVLRCGFIFYIFIANESKVRERFRRTHWITRIKKISIKREQNLILRSFYYVMHHPLYYFIPYIYIYSYYIWQLWRKPFSTWTSILLLFLSHITMFEFRSSIIYICHPSHNIIIRVWSQINLYILCCIPSNW